MDLFFASPTVHEQSDYDENCTGDEERDAELGFPYVAVARFEFDVDSVVYMTGDCLYQRVEDNVWDAHTLSAERETEPS